MYVLQYPLRPDYRPYGGVPSGRPVAAALSCAVHPIQEARLWESGWVQPKHILFVKGGHFPGHRGFLTWGS